MIANHSKFPKMPDLVACCLGKLQGKVINAVLGSTLNIIQGRHKVGAECMEGFIRQYFLLFV